MSRSDSPSWSFMFRLEALVRPMPLPPEPPAGVGYTVRKVVGPRWDGLALVSWITTAVASAGIVPPPLRARPVTWTSID